MGLGQGRDRPACVGRPGYRGGAGPAAAAALGLPGPAADPVWRLVAAFLVGYPPAHRAGLLGRPAGLVGWCAEQGRAPASRAAAPRGPLGPAARRGRSRRPAGRPRPPPSPAGCRACPGSTTTASGRSNCWSTPRSPTSAAPRCPTTPPPSGCPPPSWTGCSPPPSRTRRGPRRWCTLLVYNGLRIDEALACDVTSLTYHRGHRALRITRKGGSASTEPLAPIVPRPAGLPRRPHRRAVVPQPRRHRPPGYTTATPSSAGSPAAPASPPPTGSARTACGTASPPSCSATASRCRTCRTPWATPTPAPPAATTAPGTTSTGTPPTPWPADSAAELINQYSLMSGPARRNTPLLTGCGRRGRCGRDTRCPAGSSSNRLRASWPTTVGWTWTPRSPRCAATPAGIGCG